LDIGGSANSKASAGRCPHSAVVNLPRPASDGPLAIGAECSLNVVVKPAPYFSRIIVMQVEQRHSDSRAILRQGTGSASEPAFYVLA
jgi:hypothetical protein